MAQAAALRTRFRQIRVLTLDELHGELAEQRDRLSECGERWLEAKAAGKPTSALDAEASSYYDEIRRLEKLARRYDYD
jgi:hypothetical protein